MKTKTIKPTKAQAEKVLRAVQDKYGVSDEYGPKLVMDFDWFGYGGKPTIVWEGGPYEWAIECSFSLLNVLADDMPDVWLEPATNWALSIYREVER